MRIIARLVDARNGYQIWSGAYDDKLENLLAVQKRVAEAILLSLRVKLDRGEVAVRVRRIRSKLAFTSCICKGGITRASETWRP